MDISKPADRKSLKEQIYDAIAAVLTLVIPLSLTLVLWERERDRVELEARSEFEFLVREITEAVRMRMLGYEQLLRGAAALFSITDTVTRSAWRDYVQLMKVSKSYPGIAAIAYVAVVPADRLGEFVERIQKSDVSGYRVWPEGERPIFAPTLYLEPLTAGNLNALGFDLYSDPVRLAALETARDSGEATLTARIMLVEDTAEALAMYVPIYRRGTDPGNPNQRRAALSGFVGGGFRVNEMFAGMVGEPFNLDLEIVDGSATVAAFPLAQRRTNTDARVSGPKFTAQTRLDLNNRIWTLNFASSHEFERAAANDKSTFILVGGVLFGGILIAFLWSLASTRNRALRLASEITAELRLKQDALSASEERLNLALQGSDLVLFDWNVATGRIELSEQWAAMLGDPPHATTTGVDELALLVHPDDASRLQSEVGAVLSGAQKFYAVEHRVRNRQGEWLWVLSRAKVVERAANGRALRVTGTNADITARKLVEQMKNEFVGNVSHELRTPLTVIVGSLALLKEDLTGLTADQKMMLAMACENSARLQALVDDILDFEKIASGAMPFNLQRIALGPFLDRAIELNRVYADRYKVRYELRGPLPVVTIQTDPERLMQVLTNLLSNAAKFSPGGAAVTVSANHDGDWVRILVTDCGPGIPPEFRDRIFQKFAQADSSDTRQKSGTGLGLSICKAIVEKLGGRIGFESEPGQGATFYVDLPGGAGAA